MDVERQEGMWYQMNFLKKLDDVRHAPGGEGGTGTAGSEEPQASTASDRERALVSDLMERICKREGLVNLVNRYVWLQQ